MSVGELALVVAVGALLLASAPSRARLRGRPRPLIRDARPIERPPPPAPMRRAGIEVPYRWRREEK